MSRQKNPFIVRHDRKRKNMVQKNKNVQNKFWCREHDKNSELNSGDRACSPDRRVHSKENASCTGTDTSVAHEEFVILDTHPIKQNNMDLLRGLLHDVFFVKRKPVLHYETR